MATFLVLGGTLRLIEAPAVLPAEAAVIRSRRGGVENPEHHGVRAEVADR